MSGATTCDAIICTLFPRTLIQVGHEKGLTKDICTSVVLSQLKILGRTTMPKNVPLENPLQRYQTLPVSRANLIPEVR